MKRLLPVALVLTALLWVVPNGAAQASDAWIYRDSAINQRFGVAHTITEAAPPVPVVKGGVGFEPGGDGLFGDGIKFVDSGSAISASTPTSDAWAGNRTVSVALRLDSTPSAARPLLTIGDSMTCASGQTPFSLYLRSDRIPEYCHKYGAGAGDIVTVTATGVFAAMSVGDFDNLIVRVDTFNNRIEMTKTTFSTVLANVTYASDQDPLSTSGSSYRFASGAGSSANTFITLYEVREWREHVSTTTLRGVAAIGGLQGSEEGAWFFEGEPIQVTEWEDWITQSTSTTGAIGTTAFTVVTTPHGANVDRQSVWVISATYTAPSGPPGGTQTFQFNVDGAAIAGCTWSIARTTLGLGVGVMTTESNFYVRCLNATAVNAGPHTLSITIGGTTIVTASRTDVTLRQTDFHIDRTTAIQRRFNAVDVQLVSLQHDLDYVNTTTIRIDRNETNDLVYTNGLINSTSLITWARQSFTNSNVNSTHAHIDAHFQFTNALFNDTFQDAIFNITVGSQISNETVRLLANEFGLQLGETSTLNILIILAMVVIGVWMYRKQDHDLPIRLTGILIVLTAGVIALATATAWSGGIIFAALVIFLAVGLMLYGMFQSYNERKRNKRKGELTL